MMVPAVAALASLLADSVQEPVDSIAPWLAGLAFAADAPKTSGVKLGVTMLRAGGDPRPLITPGQTITVSIGVNNLRGDAEARSVVLTATLPDGLKLEQARPPPDRNEHGNAGANLTWNLGAVAAGAFPSLFELDLTSAGNVGAGKKLTVSATVAASDGGAEQPRSSTSFTVLVEPAVADLAVSSNLDAVAVTVSEPVKFTAEVGNWGTAVASASALTLSLPPKVSFKSSDPAPTSTSANTVTWQLGDLPPAASRTVVVTVAVDMSVGIAPESVLKFRFDASTPTTDVNPENNRLEITRHVELAGPDLKVWLNVQGADEPGELTVGKDVTYVILYGNFGNQAASGATLSLSLAEGLSFLGAEPKPTGAAKSDRFGGGVMSWSVGDLGVGDSKTVTASVHVTSVPDYGSLTMATIAAPGPDIDPGNNVAYSYLHAARKPPTRGTGAGGGGHAVRNLSLAALALALSVAVFRALRRRHGRANASK